MGEKALSPALAFDAEGDTYESRIGGSRRKASDLEVALAKRHDIEAALNADREWGAPAIFADRLTGTNLYELSIYDGSAACQTTVFVEAKPSETPRLVDGPPWPNDPQHMVCQGYGSGASFAHAFGQDVWVVRDKITGEVKGVSLTIYPRTASGWAPGCKLDLNFAHDFKVAREACRDSGVCVSSKRIARQVVKQYRAGIDSPEPRSEFRFGPPAPKHVSNRARALQDALPTPAFVALALPFGGPDADNGYPPWGFGGDPPDLFPVKIAGHWRIAAVGQDMIGWRTNEYTDFAVYDVEGKRFKPLAVFAVRRFLTGLITAKAGAPDQNGT